ncbi:T7SS effector LXG polymorphic toxin [Bacillus sonorensis]|uniref:T7SS effector LXG polymorphic toxin n=1 Tax=Bacillus sonorensis TaxID=119858 RepID=UPI00227ECC00|nr:T7SS effector LXG polymorphic toxin [Bacillus sonorensis]MCY8025648.1 T7SS effector LXG polymorphic toxin [Bacillus sonorensis]MCY8087588.1 T7SS effector LXG polymorphic toxin [Bacillus sonorensis]MCY8271462.1 T7SS effector LXG polymorphic toxin [Bacillus sonorensis]MCY8603998.1 T7SS effector LXG polymorphic toxin [Bacillus sonorensis]
MKTLDVQALHNAIDQTLEQLKQQSDEFSNVKKAVEGITSLDDALKGKGGDAIRAFYEECHTPFLQFYDTFIEEYSSTLKKMKSALNSLEPNHNGFISQSFLEHELENGLNAADRTTKHLVSKANTTIAKVSHIVDLPDLNDNEFHEQNRKALTDINQTIEKLHAFDREQTNALNTAENDLETMQKYIARLEKMYTGPKIEITGYQKGSILKPDEMDALRGDQETAMRVMLKKVGEKEETEINKPADTYRTKKLSTQKVPKKVYTDEEIENLSKEELAKLKKVYKDVNGFKYCFYMDGKNVVGIKLVDDPPEDDEEVSDLEKYAGIGLELLGESDLERAALGYDPDTHERLSFFERVEAGVNLTPPARLIKWIRRGTKLAKVSKVGKGAKTPSYGKQSVPKGPYREVNGFPAKVKPGAQEKHIPGTPNYKQEVANGKKKSIFYGDNKKAQELLDKYAGKGEILKNGREVVDFGQKIGKAYDMKTGKYIETTRGTIHYSKDGAHIVPAKPLEP